ncbi:tripartite tricarboxylate transporter substrate binding protein [Aquabacterium sp. J223]|uniref:Bug family tripartite tricarboxylate transporter substrate binding protein n=1 Tax=Aquabacterium sp. J223 TaxID=2898431 RepID=UPI0021ADB424|nr:tripartite tricarboxylate transporter substrate-binding protein [Aquabacterium sp. J223]UUX94498.1 tripartite tricarboxylate transporter substrate binding protein [Aquabacterium sp. J223]
MPNDRPTDAARRRSLQRLTVAATAPWALPAALSSWALPARAQGGYPSKPVRIVVPFPPGGATDALVRLLAERLGQRWNQTVLVENKPGANTTLGTDVVAKSAPDGHVLGVVTGSHNINPLLTQKLPYDTLKDLVGVMAITRSQMAIYAHPSLPASTPAEFIALAKKQKVAYGSATTQSFLGMELLSSMAGVKMEYVPYKGSAQAMNDLMGGHLMVMIDPVLQSTVEHVKNGRMKLIGTLGARPGELTPQTPTFASVVPGYDFSATFGLITRAGTPPEVVRRIRDEFAAVMATPEVTERIRAFGQEVVASTPEAYQAYIVDEMRKWEPVVKATGAKLD